MKILMLNYEFPPVGGGAGPVTLELCRQLVKFGHHVDVVTMAYDNLPDFECLDGVNVYRTPALRKRPDICHIHEMATYLPGALPKVLQLVRQVWYDVIHCHFIFPTEPLALLISKITGIPFLVTCHGSDVPGYNPDRFGLSHKLLMPGWRFLIRRTPLIISPSESLKRLIHKQASYANVKVIPNGFNTDMFEPAAKEKSILLCSRLLPRKGFQYAIEAIKQLAPDWTVNVVGDGPFLPELKRIAEGSETPINFLGWLDRGDQRFRRLFETGSICIFPSEAENFPTVLLEAMAAGMAVITSTAGGCPEVVGQAALLVEPHDTAAIRRQLEKLIDSEELRRKLSYAARRRTEMFGWPAVTRKYLDQYQNVIDNWEQK
ncbi:MAG: glycosyltransferase family 4 protein [Sedimentisphaerales bacterium]|nr:glycosyltransferase family 4 protein [Sedimentisphaerales bacterium]